MPKVISVLEELEDYASRFESEDREIVTLQAAVERLELEKLDRVEDQNRYEKELEQVEDTWRAESKELLQLIERLQAENAQLKESIQEKSQDKVLSSAVRTSGEAAAEEIQLMLRLKNVIDRQKVELRSLRRQLTQKAVDLDAMQQQATRLAKLNAELRRKHCVSKRQTDQLLEDKADLELQLQAKEQLIQEMRNNVYPTRSKEGNDDQSTIAPSATVPVEMSLSMMSDLTSPGVNPLVGMTEEQLIERLNDEGKMIIDKRDPNRPRFTLHELREVLLERNELKSRLIEVEEELSVYKRAGDDCPPVQGPINREPDEKLRGLRHSEKDSGIKRFFDSLLAKLNS